MKKYLQNQKIDVQSRYSEANLEYVKQSDEQEVIDFLKQDTTKEFFVRNQEGEAF